MVAIFFGIITRQAIGCGTFRSVCDLETAIKIYIDGWNERAHLFTWTKNADDTSRTRETAGARDEPEPDTRAERPSGVVRVCSE